MPSYFTVVRFLPNVSAGEFVNIAVLAWGDGRIRSRFLDDLSRAEDFCEGHYFREAFEHFRQWVEGPVHPDGPRTLLDEDTLKKAIERWYAGCINFSGVFPYNGSPDEAIATMAPLYLIEAKVSHLFEKTEVVSAPGAAVTVTQYTLRDDVKKTLCIDSRALSARKRENT